MIYFVMLSIGEIVKLKLTNTRKLSRFHKYQRIDTLIIQPSGVWRMLNSDGLLFAANAKGDVLERNIYSIYYAIIARLHEVLLYP